MAKKKPSRSKKSSSVSKSESKLESKSVAKPKKNVSASSAAQSKSEKDVGSGSSMSSLKWLLVAIFGVAGVFGNLKFHYVPFAERLVILIILGLVMLGLALSTKSGKVFSRFVMDAKYEMRKVSWPTRHEMTQLTIIVIVVVAIASLILWAVDGFFNYIITRLIT